MGVRHPVHENTLQHTDTRDHWEKHWGICTWAFGCTVFLAPFGLSGALKYIFQVSFAKEPYKRDDILQKRHIKTLGNLHLGFWVHSVSSSLGHCHRWQHKREESCVCTCMCVHIHLYVFVCIHTCVCILCVYTHTCESEFPALAQRAARTRTTLSIHMYVCIHIRVYICVCKYIYMTLCFYCF